MTNLPHHSHDIHPNQLPEAEGGDCEEGCSSRYLEEQVGRGHGFAPVGTFNPTWCDLCRDLVWGLYDTGAMRCANCQLTCHEKCKDKVQLNCTAFERPESPYSNSTGSSNSNSSSEKDLSTLANISTIVDEEVSEEFDDDQGTLKNVDLL